MPDGEDTISAINKVIGILSSIDLTSKDFLGKIFHKLIPLEIRKHIAAFYTSNIGGRLLAELSIQDENDKILDLACGSGTLLIESYKYKKRLKTIHESEEQKIHKKLLSQIFGNDVVIFATHLATMNIALQSQLSYTDSVSICIGDGFRLHPGKTALNQMFLTYYLEKAPKKQDFNGESEKSFIIPIVNVVIMNPPFTRHERMAKEFLNKVQHVVKQEGNSEYISGKMSLQHYFLMHADSFLEKDGFLSFVIPTNTFNVELSQKLINFLKDKKYHLQYLIINNSKSGTFSLDCNFKEYLFIAQKGNFKKDSYTKLIMFSDLPKYESANKIIKFIKNTNTNKNEKIDDIEISAKIVKTQSLYSSTKWDTKFWDLDNKKLLKVFENEKLTTLKENNEFSFKTGFHSTHCEYLTFPNELFSVERDLGDHGLEIKRIEDGEKIIIPKKFLRKSLREPKLYQNIISNASHWVLSIDKTDSLPVDFSQKVLEYSTNILSKIIIEKAKKGGKVKDQLNKFWYCHPHDTGCDTKVGNLWTFNRYGLWLRANASIYTKEQVTANDGFHLYKYSGQNDEKESLIVLNSWYNSSIHLYDFLKKCRVPAIHVQQVLKNDREVMYVPIISKLKKEEIQKIINVTNDFSNNVQGNILEQFDDEPRRKLDYIWLSILGFPTHKKESYLKELYRTLHFIIENR